MKQKRLTLRLLILFALIMVFGISSPGDKAMAATAVQVAAVEYYDNNIVVFNNGNTKIYFATDSDAAASKWDSIPADPGMFTTIDFSWISVGSESVIMIKGDVVSTVSRVVIKEKPKRMDINVNYSNIGNLSPTATIASLLNIMTTEGTAANPITYDDLEWKKGTSGKWENTNTLTVGLLDKYMVRGANLYFRIRAVDESVSVTEGGLAVDLNLNRKNGIDGGICAYESTGTFGSNYPDGTKGRRFSDEVLVKIVRKTASMVYGIDGEDFTASIKYGKEYKVTATYKDGTQGTSDWIKVMDKSVKDVSLATIANGVSPSYVVSGSAVIFDGETVAFPAMDIEVRDYATTKTAASKSSTISLDAQRELTKSVKPGQPVATELQDAEDIYVKYYGNKYILLTIPMASASLPYEYCVVKSGETFDLEHANWYLVTKGTSTKILASRAVQGATLYIRQKEIKSKAATKSTSAVSYQLASTYVTFTVDYPSVPVIAKTNLTYVKGFATPQVITVQLNESGKNPFEEAVKSIKLGTKEIGFTSNTVTTGGGIKIMTITLNNTELEAMTNSTNRILTITFENDTVDKVSVKITIKNPTPAGSLTFTPVASAVTSGAMKVTIAGTLGSGNTWEYVVGTSPVTDVTTENTLPIGTGTPFTSGMEINGVVVNQYLTIYELDASRHIVKYKSVQLTANMIK